MVAIGLLTMLLAMAAGSPGPPGAAATRSIMCPCDTTSQKQQWNISSLGNASFVTNLLAVSEGLDACLAVWSDQDPRHAVEGQKCHFWRHLDMKCIVLPRQARDKHRENSKKEWRFA